MHSVSYLTAFWSGVAQALVVVLEEGQRMKFSPRPQPAKAILPAEYMEALFPLTFAQWRQTAPQTGVASALMARGSQLASAALSRNPDRVLLLLFRILGLAYASSSELRRHTKDLHARYQFLFEDREAALAAEFRSGRLHVKAETMLGPDVTVIFRNGRAVKDLLFAPKPDILAAILAQEITVEGNLTYLYKLAFLIRHIQQQIAGGGGPV